MIKHSLQSRRKFLQNIGYISLSFSLFGSCVEEVVPTMAARTNYEGDLPRILKRASKVNAWLEILEDGRVRVFTGKVELGQGIRRAIQMVAAEELDMDLEKVEVHLAETGVTPNEGYTAGSASIKNSAMSVRYAAATARSEILKLASIKLDTAIEELLFLDGIIKSNTNKQSLTIQELLEGRQIEMEVTGPVPLKSKEEYQYVGKAIPRTAIKEMVLGKQIYVQDLRFPGMVHARIIRPPNYKSQLIRLDDSKLSSTVPGIIKTVINGNFIGVIAEKEYQAVRAAHYLKTQCNWKTPEIFPEMEELYGHIREIANEPKNIRNDGNIKMAFEQKETIKAQYTKPYTKHGSMGPACAVALYDKEVLHVWSHSQGIYPLREALANMLKMDKEKIHIMSVPGAGCFGHSTADDAAADASVLALAYPEKHIRLQWSRSDEYKWDPYGSAIIAEIEACLDESGKIEGWKSDVWTDSHSTRPNSDAGTVLVARHLKPPLEMQSQGYLAGGHRNAIPYYKIPNLQLNAHYFDGPFRVSSLRSLGAFANIFAIETVIDKLAEKASKDPLIFRIEHLDDERAIDLIRKIKGMTATTQLADDEGIGYAFVRYKNTEAYASVAAKVTVNKSTGAVSILKMWAVIDAGEIINLDGIKNQAAGGMLQAASWTLKEQVTFDRLKITSTDWSSYPVFRYTDIPEVEIAVIDRPDQPALGAGEVTVPPAGAAIANAIYNACGKRIDHLPITADKMLA